MVTELILEKAKQKPILDVVEEHKLTPSDLAALIKQSIENRKLKFENN